MSYLIQSVEQTVTVVQGANMEVYDIRSLMSGEKRKYPMASKISFLHHNLSVLIEKRNITDFTEYDWFQAGYILANPVVCEQLGLVMKHKDRIKPISED